MKITVNHSCSDFGSYRAERVKSLFNCEDGHNFTAGFDLPLESRTWRIGAIIGPSGSGKTSIGRQLGKLYSPSWPDNKPVIDARLQM